MDSHDRLPWRGDQVPARPMGRPVQAAAHRRSNPEAFGFREAFSLWRLSFDGACRSVVQLVERWDDARRSVHYDI